MFIILYNTTGVYIYIYSQTYIYIVHIYNSIQHNGCLTSKFSSVFKTDRAKASFSKWPRWQH